MALTMVANMVSGLRLSDSILVIAGLASLAPSASAHTWIEQMQVIGTNGSYIGDYGYPRGYVARTDKGYNGDSDKWQLPNPETQVNLTRINDEMLMCHTTQRTANYSSEYPKLQVAPGSYVAMKYLENGHVTQPWLPEGKPDETGTVWVYGTYHPSATEKFTDVLAWTTDGKGGNGKGWMMTAQSFDDGRCYQINNNMLSVDRRINHGDHVKDQPTSQIEQWCETDLKVPTDAKIGSTLTTYWVWSWDTAPFTNGTACGKDEYYTTCSDFDVVDGGDDLAKLASVPLQHTLLQQDPQSTAVSNYQSRTALTPMPVIVPQTACAVADRQITHSSWPASITQQTSMPTTMPTTFVTYPAMRTYNLQDAQKAAAPTLQQSAASSSSTSASAQSSATATPSTSTSSSTPAAIASSGSFSPSSSYSLSGSSSSSSLSSCTALPGSTVTVTSTATTTSIQFSTIIITATPSEATPAASTPAAPTNVVVSKNCTVMELGRRSHPRAVSRLTT